MSLFKVCSWWTVQCPDVLENYDSSSMICCRLGLEENEKDYIVIGSHSGHLSIFYPTSELTEDGSHKGYRPTDLVMETKLKAPILGLTSGRFSGTLKSEKTNHLAILHPNSICIYSISTVDGVAEHGTHSSLHLINEYKFLRYAYSLCKGHFGGIKGREFLCVTHMDGNVTFFEQDGIHYECILPGENTIPSPLVYVPRTDSFVRINSLWQLECYSYQDMSQSATNKTTLLPLWSVCIGEFALNLVAVQVTTSRTSIMILGERNLINISDDGNVQFIKKLDYPPVCFHSFVLGWYWEPNARLITAIVSESASLLIYEETKLIWAAQLENVPIAIERSNLHNLPGGLVFLGANGIIRVGFLGSEPHIFKVPPLGLQDISFENAQKQLIELEKEIKLGIDMSDAQMINASAERDLELKVAVSPELHPCTFSDVSADVEKEEHFFMCSAEIQITSRINIDQIQICFNYADGIKCSNPVVSFNDLLANSTEALDAWFYRSDRFPIASTQVEVIVSFINKQSIPRVITKKFLLPLKLLYDIVPAQKDAKIKITLTVDNNENAKNHRLSSIFPDACENSEAQAIGLQPIYSESVVTVVVAKNTNRFRIQSDCMEAISAVIEIIIKFFSQFEQTHIKPKTKGKKNKISKQKIVIIGPQIPVEEIIKKVTNHFGIQQEIKKQTEWMDALWRQFKLFQRSLQSKKEGDPIDGLMWLIEKNYDDLVKEGDKLVELRQDERIKRNELSCGIALARQIVSCLDLDDNFTEGLAAVLVSPIEDWTEKCWEETVAPSFEFLNHYGPLSKNRNTTFDSSSLFASTKFEFDRLKRHMTSLMERVCRFVTDPKQRSMVSAAPLNSSKNRNPSSSSDIVNKPKSHNDENQAASEVAGKTERTISKESSVGNLTETLEDDDEEEDCHKAKDSDWLSSEIPAADILKMGQVKKEDLEI